MSSIFVPKAVSFPSPLLVQMNNEASGYAFRYTQVQSVDIPTFWERSTKSSEKVHLYLCICTSSMCVVFYPMNAFIAIRCYKSPRSFAILVDFILSALQLSHYMDEISFSVKDSLHFQQVHLSQIFCDMSWQIFSILYRDYKTLYNSLCTFVALMTRLFLQSRFTCLSCSFKSEAVVSLLPNDTAFLLFEWCSLLALREYQEARVSPELTFKWCTGQMLKKPVSHCLPLF